MQRHGTHFFVQSLAVARNLDLSFFRVFMIRTSASIKERAYQNILRRCLARMDHQHLGY